MSNNTLPSQNRAANPADEDINEKLRDWVDEHSSLLEILLDPYCVLDLANNIFAVNTAFEDFVGESQRKIKKNPQFNNFVKTEFCPGQSPAIQVVTSERSLRLDMIAGSTKKHIERTMTISGVPIFSREKKLIGSLLNIRDLTDETRLQHKYKNEKTDAITDGLTHLYNKNFTETFLKKSVRSCQRNKSPLTVAIADVDHFKRVNDTYGHQAGDYILSSVAELLKKETRENDVASRFGIDETIAGRFGGEEFVVILSNCGSEGAMVFAERFRQKLSNTNFTFKGIQIPITVSIGTATFPPPDNFKFISEEIANELIRRADMALYAAKSEGRNQTRQFESLPENKKTGPKAKD
jgi:diguanylate cyclase (GGDEF)-like protein/PAS domain S-box-containing protein